VLVKKEINAIFENEFTQFLEKIGKIDDFRNGLLKCCICGSIITEDNIAMIIKTESYEYVCNNQACLLRQIRRP